MRVLLADTNQAAQGVGPASGIVQVAIGPVRPGQMWKLKRATIQCAPQNTALNEFNLYVGPQGIAGAAPDASYLRDHSYSGDGDVSDETNMLPVMQGEYITGRWSAVLQNSVATLTVVYDVLDMNADTD